MNVRRTFVKYVSQNILGLLGVSCYILADTFFISRAAGANGITVLNLCLPLYNFIFAVGSLVGVGAATRFAICRARGDQEKNAYFSNAVFFLLLFSLPFILVGIFGPDKLLGLLGADSSIAALGKNYARIFLVFAPCFMLNYVFSAYVRNDGAPTLAMIATLSGSIFNIVFDYVFMFPLGMGMPGAALATGASPVIGIAICLTHFFRKENTIGWEWRRPSFQRLAQSAQLGVSAAVAELSSAVITIVFNFLLLGLAGNTGVAAYGIVANLALVAVAIFNGIAQGQQPILSECYGKGDKKALGVLLRMGALVALAFAILLEVGICSFTNPIIAIFNSEGNAQLASYAFLGLRLYFMGYLFAGINIVLTGYFSATDQAGPAGILSLSRGLVAIVLFAILLAKLFGLAGVWSSFPVAEAFTLAMGMGFLWKFHRSLE